MTSDGSGLSGFRSDALSGKAPTVNGSRSKDPDSPSQDDDGSDGHPGCIRHGRRRKDVMLGLTAVASLTFAAWHLWSTQDIWWKPQHPIERTLGRFDFEDSTILIDQIVVGNTRENGIPSLSTPNAVSAAAASHIADTDRVIGVRIENRARAYPLSVMAYHEVVNDRFQEIPVAVTYCPLCDSAAVIDRRSPAGEREFSASGILYNNNVLFVSSLSGEERSLWSQLYLEGVTGTCSGIKLEAWPVELTTWKDWQSRNPDTDVLTFETGFDRDYANDPYADYHKSLFSPLLEAIPAPPTDILFRKWRVLGVWDDEAHLAKAYCISEFPNDAQDTVTIEESIGDQRITIAYNPEAESLRVVNADDGLRWMYAYWFGWYAFFPHTQVYTQPP